MGLAEKLDKHRWLTGAAAVVVLALGLYLIVASQPHANVSRRYFYYDLEEGKLIVSQGNEAKKDLLQLAEAKVMSCGDCADEQSRFVAYIQMLDPKARHMHLGLHGAPIAVGGGSEAPLPGTADETVLVAKPQKHPTWLKSGSDEGRELVDQAAQCDNGDAANPCAHP